MPRIVGTDMNIMHIAGNGNFHFSAIRPDVLGATEYTLVTLVTDRSGSVANFSDDIDKMEDEVIKSCSKSPRSDNLMIRRVHFNHTVIEENGFVPLSLLPLIKPVSCGGNTALFDAVYTSIEATLSYADTLQKNDYTVNGVIFIITDGDDNASINTEPMILKLMEEAIKSERIESLHTILIGVNDTDLRLKKYLEDFVRRCKLSSYESLGKVDAESLAKLAQFISKSISSQSQSLGSGAASQLLTI